MIAPFEVNKQSYVTRPGKPGSAKQKDGKSCERLKGFFKRPVGVS
jgi:hypothetical protein